MPLKILLAEDFAPFRQILSSKLQTNPEFQVIGQTSDGFEAIQKTKELRPELILLDIGLPGLNGIEVAKQVHGFAPQTKLLVVSAERSFHVIRESFRAGANGYVHKRRVLKDLLPAIKTLMTGGQFVSGGQGLNRGAKLDACHQALFCSSDSALVEGFAQFIAKSMKVGNAAVTIATQSHQESLFRRLKEAGIDMDAAIEQGTYISLDAAEVLSAMNGNGTMNRAWLFENLRQIVESALKAAKAEHPRVVICGECVGILCAEGKLELALQLEKVGNDLANSFDVDILCAYPAEYGMGHEQDDGAFESICAEHTCAFF